MAKPTAVVEQERPGVARVVDTSLSPLAFYQMRRDGLKRELAAAEARGVAHLRKGTAIEMEAMEVALAMAEALERIEKLCSARDPADTDYSRWRRKTAEQVGEILGDIRALVAHAKGDAA